METTRIVFSRTWKFSSVLYGIALFTFATFCECKLFLLKTTPGVITDTPKQCVFNNIKYGVGENWNPFLLPKGYFRCIRCTCKLAKDGSIAIVDCKTCSRKVTKTGRHPEEGQKSCKIDNITRKHGTVWTMPPAEGSTSLQENQCTECSCTDGFVTCAVRSCPVLSCKNQRNGTHSCCPVCEGDLQTTRHPAGCETMGRHYDNLEKWFPRLPPKYDLCVTCTCKNTSVVCHKPTCPKVTCSNPVKKPGACCDFCPASSQTKKLPKPVRKTIGGLISLILRVRNPFRNDELISKTRVGRKVPGECTLGEQRFPHNSSFHPKVGSFGVSYCILCFCVAPEIICDPVQCPSNYSCPQPVTVPGKCCKECRDGESTGSSTPGSNGRRFCHGKYWRFFEYQRSGSKKQIDRTNIRVHFAFEDGENNIVEIHSLVANITNKTVTVTNTTKRVFEQVNKNNNYIYRGKIREVQIVKLRENEKRPCHYSHGCVHTVRKIKDRLRGRVSHCVNRGPPDTLKMLKNKLTEPGT